jgi:hypothetical protein
MTERRKRLGPNELRYLNPENIAKDFPTKRDRAAIEAVFKWLSFTAICAWPIRGRGNYTTTVSAKDAVRCFSESSACVIQSADIERAEKILIGHRKRPKRLRP